MLLSKNTMESVATHIKPGGSRQIPMTFNGSYLAFLHLVFFTLKKISTRSQLSKLKPAILAFLHRPFT